MVDGAQLIRDGALSPSKASHGRCRVTRPPIAPLGKFRRRVRSEATGNHPVALDRVSINHPLHPCRLDFHVPLTLASPYNPVQLVWAPQCRIVDIQPHSVATTQVASFSPPC